MLSSVLLCRAPSRVDEEVGADRSHPLETGRVSAGTVEAAQAHSYLGAEARSLGDRAQSAKPPEFNARQDTPEDDDAAGFSADELGDRTAQLLSQIAEREIWRVSLAALQQADIGRVEVAKLCETLLRQASRNAGLSDVFSQHSKRNFLIHHALMR